MQYDMEIQRQNQIEGIYAISNIKLELVFLRLNNLFIFSFAAMYESEAKTAAVLHKEAWAKEASSREKLLKSVISEQMQHIDKEIAHNSNRQHELEATKQTHRQAIEGTIERIKDLTIEQHADDQQVLIDAKNTPKMAGSRAECVPAADNVDSIELIDAVKTTEQAMNGMAIANELFVRPKFGRKKIAWT